MDRASGSFLNPHRYEGNNYGKETYCIEKEAYAFTDKTNNDAGYRRSHEPGTVKHEGIEGNGVA